MTRLHWVEKRRTAFSEDTTRNLIKPASAALPVCSAATSLFMPLSKPLKTKELTEKARSEYFERERKTIGLGVIRSHT